MLPQDRVITITLEFLVQPDGDGLFAFCPAVDYSTLREIRLFGEQAKPRGGLASRLGGNCDVALMQEGLIPSGPWR